MTRGRRGPDEWTKEAACSDEPPQRFTDPRDGDEVRAALKTCAGCAVRPQCLSTALTHTAETDVGIWGGTTTRTRDRIRNGELTIDKVLQQVRGKRPEEPERDGDRATPTSVEVREVAGNTAVQTVPRLPAPELTLGRDANGDYVDASGRVIVFRIHGDPPYMLMIDDHCIARTRTVTEARRLAWTALHDEQPARTSPSGALVRGLVRR